MLSYALSGYLIARLGSFPTAAAGAWMPWLFWLAHRVVSRRDPRTVYEVHAVGWLALAFGMQLLAGHAQTTLYSSFGVGLYVLWRAAQDRRGVGGILLAGVGVALGAGVAAVQLIPTAEYLQESQRSGGLDYETLANLSYHPLRLFTLLSPDFFGTPADGSYLAKGIYFEDAAYIGVIPLISALAAITGWIRKRRALDVFPTFRSVPFWAGLALIALVIGMGRHGPVFRLLYDTVPTFDAFREPVRWLILTEFSLCVLAGIGTDHWGRGRWVVFWSRLAAAGGGAMVLMALVALYTMEMDSDTLRVLSQGIMVLGCGMVGAALLTLTQPVDPAVNPWPGAPRLWRVIVLVFVALDLAWMAHGLNPTVPDAFFDIHKQGDVDDGRIYWFDDTERAVTFGSEGDADTPPIQGYFDVTDYRVAVDHWREVRASRLPNINMLDRIPALNNNDPLLPADHSRYIDLIEEVGADAAPLLHAAGVTQVYGMVPDGWQGENPAIAPYADEVVQAWLVPEALWLDPDEAIEDALRDPSWDPMQTVILTGTPDAIPPGSAGGEVALVSAEPSERRYRVSADGAAYLVIAETWYPGWSAAVNGNTAKLYRANLAFQAVAVPAGESDVVLRYELRHWRLGVGISLLSLVLIAALIIAPRFRRVSHG